MIKKILPLAVAAALVPAAAMAESTLYGKVHVSVDSADNAEGALTSLGNGDVNSADVSAGDDAWAVTSRASRLGVKGSEDLGNGLKAVYQMEFGIDVDENAGINSGRNTFGGISGDFGSVLVGRHDTPYKMSVGAAELFTDRPGDFNQAGLEDHRVNNVIAYISPNFGGATVAAAIVPGEGGDADGLADAFSLGVMYNNGPIFVGGGYESRSEELLGGTDDETKMRLGAKFSMDMFTVSGVIEDGESRNGGQDDDWTMWGLQGKVAFGNNAIVGMYGSRDGDGTLDDVDTWMIGGEHMLSKRTFVYAQFANREVGSAEGDVFSLGLSTSF